MPEDHITNARAGRIARRATALWRLFLTSQDTIDCGPRGFFDPFYLGEGAEDFPAERLFKFASDFVYGRSGIRIFLRPIDKRQANHLFGLQRDRKSAVSRWLPIINPGGGYIPVVAILRHDDFPDRGPRGYRINKPLAWTWNLVHEIGHLLLHHHSFVIDGRLFRAANEPLAGAREEEEAWCFAACIMGLAGGNEAFNDRSSARGPAFGAPWELLSWVTRPRAARGE